MAQRRVAQIHTYQQGLAMGDSLLTQGLNFQVETPDPTTPDGKLSLWLDKVAREKSPPPHREEGLRRLNLALETALIASRDAKTYADEFAGAAWDDGVCAALDLFKAFQGMNEMIGKKAALTPDEGHALVDGSPRLIDANNPAVAPVLKEGRTRAGLALN